MADIKVAGVFRFGIEWHSAEDIDTMMKTLRKAKKDGVYPFIYVTERRLVEAKNGKR